MSYFEKFKDVEETDDLEVEVTLAPKGRATDWIKDHAMRKYDNPKDNPFLAHYCNSTNTGGEQGFWALMSAKHYLGDKVADRLFKEYNDGLEKGLTKTKKDGHRIYWTYKGWRHASVETAEDYFLNVAFGNQEEADKILEGIERSHDAQTRYQSAYSLLALAHAGRKELVKKSLDFLIDQKVIINDYVRSCGTNAGGYFYWCHSIGIQKNSTIALACELIGEDLGRRISKYVQTWPECHDGVCWDFGIFDLKPDDPELQISPCSKKDILAGPSGHFLEMLKMTDPEAYQISRSKLMSFFIDTFPEGFDEDRNLPYASGIPEHFILLAAAQEVPLFQ